MYSQKYSTLKIWPKMANLCTGGRNRVKHKCYKEMSSKFVVVSICERIVINTLILWFCFVKYLGTIGNCAKK